MSKKKTKQHDSTVSQPQVCVWVSGVAFAQLYKTNSNPHLLMWSFLSPFLFRIHILHAHILHHSSPANTLPTVKHGGAFSSRDRKTCPNLGSDECRKIQRRKPATKTRVTLHSILFTEGQIVKEQVP